MDSNTIRGLSHFFNPVTGKTTVSICYSEENTDDFFVMEYHDGQKFVPYDGINGVVKKTPRPVESYYDTKSDFYNNLVMAIYLGDQEYLPANGAIYLPALVGVERLVDLKDVKIVEPEHNQVLTYDALEEKWINEFVQVVANQHGGLLRFWAGSKEDYLALPSRDPNTLYFYTEDEEPTPEPEEPEPEYPEPN